MYTQTSEYTFALPKTPATALLMLITMRSLRNVIPTLPELKYRHCLGVVATIELMVDPKPLLMLKGKTVETIKGRFRAAA